MITISSADSILFEDTDDGGQLCQNKVFISRSSARPDELELWPPLRYISDVFVASTASTSTTLAQKRGPWSTYAAYHLARFGSDGSRDVDPLNHPTVHDASIAFVGSGCFLHESVSLHAATTYYPVSIDRCIVLVVWS